MPALLQSAEQLRPRVISTLKAAVQQFDQAQPWHKGELKVTVLTHAADGDPHICAHIAPLPARPRPPVKIQLKGQPRANAAAKDSEWVRQRQDLEASMPSDVNEICLVQQDGSVMEGLSSNIFAIVNNTVYTAGEGVLLGTVRNLILSVCRENNITVQEEAPRKADLAHWQGCIVSSTSRLALPVAEIQCCDAPGTVTAVHCVPTDGLVAKLDQLVLAKIEAMSVDVL